jgi:hypothetical protein
LSIIRWLGTFASQGELTSVEYGRNIVDILINSVHIRHEGGQFHIYIAYNLSGETEEVITNEDIAEIMAKEKPEPNGSGLGVVVHHHSINPNLYVIRGVLVCKVA